MQTRFVGQRYRSLGTPDAPILAPACHACIVDGGSLSGGAYRVCLGMMGPHTDTRSARTECATGVRLLHADLTGQAYVQAFAKRFPFDQRRFVTGCVTAGFDHGLMAELRIGRGR